MKSNNYLSLPFQLFELPSQPSWLSSSMEQQNILEILAKLALWALKVPPKIKTFLWKIASSALPLGENLRKGRITSGICLLCHSAVESWNHCLLECDWVRDLWTLFPTFSSILRHHFCSILDLCNVLSDLDFSDAAYFCTIFWFIWLARNHFVFEGMRPSVTRTSNQAQSFHQAFILASSPDAVVAPSAPIPFSWTKPKENSFKLNVDAGFKDGHGSAGALIRDHFGNLISAFSFDLGSVSSVEQAGLLAIFVSLKAAARTWSGAIMVESDSSNSIARIVDEDEDLSGLGCIATNIRSLKRFFSFCSFAYVNRLCNRPADVLEKLGFSLIENQLKFCNWGANPPSSVLSVILMDIE